MENEDAKTRLGYNLADEASTETQICRGNPKRRTLKCLRDGGEDSARDEDGD